MNADITINSIAFKRSYDDKSGSLRRDTTRGINLPQDLVIKSSQVTDQSTKVPGQRFLVQINRAIQSVDGRKATVSAHCVLSIPETAATDDVSSILATFRAAVAAEGLLEGVLNSER